MTVVPQSIAEAKNFVRVWHRHNKPPLGAVFALGLEHAGELVGVALAGRPVARNLDDGWTLEVLRTCTRPECPKGGVSKLMNACRRVAGGLGYKRCVTYTLSSESGASARGAGWKQAEILAPRSGWDTPSRRRLPGTVDDVSKIRWEVEAKP